MICTGCSDTGHDTSGGGCKKCGLGLVFNFMADTGAIQDPAEREADLRAAEMIDAAIEAMHAIESADEMKLRQARERWDRATHAMTAQG